MHGSYDGGMAEAARQEETELTLFGFGDGFDWRQTCFLETAPANKACCLCGLLSSWTAVFPCSHRACTRCYEKSVAIGCVCVVDGTRFHVYDVSWVPFSRERLAQFQIRCWNSSRGCVAVGPFFHIQRHFQIDCKCHSVRCPHCGQTVPQEEFTSHMSPNCIRLASVCSGYTLQVTTGMPTAPGDTIQPEEAGSLPSSEEVLYTTLPTDRKDASPPLFAPRPKRIPLNRFQEESGALYVPESAIPTSSSAEDNVSGGQQNVACAVEQEDGTPTRAPSVRGACGLERKQGGEIGHEDKHEQAMQACVSVRAGVGYIEKSSGQQAGATYSAQPLASVDSGDQGTDSHCHSVVSDAVVSDDQTTAALIRPSLGLSNGLSSSRENKRRAATFPASSGSSVHHSSGPPGSNAGDGGDEDAAYSCTKFTSAAAVHRADAECQVRVLPTVFSRFTQCSARLDVKSVQCDLDADWFMRITSSAGMQRKKKGSVSCMVEEQEEERRKNLPMPVAPPAPRCILCGLERTHNTMLHPLPVYKSSCQKWIDFVRQCPGRADLLGWMPPAHEQSFVCSLHFAPGSFTRLFPEKRLRPGAVPTLYPKAALIPTVGVLTGPADCVGTSF
ncbi:hypothetical protein V5799_004135 [Amblyomma americanum]|uniref:THAP-type domain-containing protein n=1 Tax=Amblyomma americanum TaxID=6943 RepID=A0AAQ4D6Z3_AMBAM